MKASRAKQEVVASSLANEVHNNEIMNLSRLTSLLALAVLFLALAPGWTRAEECGGCTPDSFTAPAPASTSTVVGGVTYTVSLTISITVYGTDCLQDEFFPLICTPDGECTIFAQGSYSSGFGGIDLSASTVNPLSSSTLLVGLPAAPSGSGFGQDRRDHMPCGQIDHQITFCLSWVSDFGSPAQVCMTTSYGCSACELGGQ